LLFANNLQAENNGNSEVFTFVEKMPEFPDGERELFRFLRENIDYPPEIEQRGISGQVVSQFVVNSDGSISDIKIIRSLDPLLDAEVVRVIEAMPNWIPGKKNDEAVNVQFSLPVRFQIEAQEIVEVQETMSWHEMNIEQIEQLLFRATINLDGMIVSEGFELKEGERLPEFPGGRQALMQFLSNHIRYPVYAQEKGIQGRVVVQFVVNIDGSVVDVQVARSVHPSLDAEAVRVVQAMPRWTPAIQRGKKVRVIFTMPFNFRMQ